MSKAHFSDAADSARGIVPSATERFGAAEPSSPAPTKPSAPRYDSPEDAANSGGTLDLTPTTNSANDPRIKGAIDAAIKAGKRAGKSRRALNRTRGVAVAETLPGAKFGNHASNIHSQTKAVVSQLSTLKDPVVKAQVELANGHLNDAAAKIREGKNLLTTPETQFKARESWQGATRDIERAHEAVNIPHVHEAAKTAGIVSELPKLDRLKEGSATARILKPADEFPVMNWAGKDIKAEDIPEKINTAAAAPGSPAEEKLSLQKGFKRQYKVDSRKPSGTGMSKTGMTAGDVNPASIVMGKAKKTRIRTTINTPASKIGVTPKFDATTRLPEEGPATPVIGPKRPLKSADTPKRMPAERPVSQSPKNQAAAERLAKKSKGAK